MTTLKAKDFFEARPCDKISGRRQSENQRTVGFVSFYPGFRTGQEDARVIRQEARYRLKTDTESKYSPLRINWTNGLKKMDYPQMIQTIQ